MSSELRRRRICERQKVVKAKDFQTKIENFRNKKEETKSIKELEAPLSNVCEK